MQGVELFSFDQSAYLIAQSDGNLVGYNGNRNGPMPACPALACLRMVPESACAAAANVSHGHVAATTRSAFFASNTYGSSPTPFTLTMRSVSPGPCWWACRAKN